MNITRRELFLSSVGALLSLAAVELVTIIKDGTLVSIVVKFSDTSASIKLFLFFSICFIFMIIIWLIGYTNVFTLNNLARIATAALGISLTTHAAISGTRLDFAEAIILGVIVLLVSLYSLIEVYTALKISPRQQTLEQHSYSESRITPDILRAYLDASKVGYENLTGELRKRGIVF